VQTTRSWGRTCVVSFGRKKRKFGRDLPEENEEGKDDIVFPALKVPVYGWRGCSWTGQCEGVRGLYG
jgi:hypothetical protein